MRSRTRSAPGEHVQELRELVDARLAEEAPERRDARVVAHLALCAPLRELGLVEVLPHVIGVGDHRAELEHAEIPTAHADRLSKARAKKLHMREI